MFVHDVIAAIRTSPLPIDTCLPRGSSKRSGVGRLFTISTTSRGAAPLCNCMDASLIAPTPWATSGVTMRLSSSAAGLANPFSLFGLLKSSVKSLFIDPSSIRSCGRFGPASDVLTEVRSSDSVFV